MHGLVQPNTELRCWFWIGFAGQEIAIPALSGFAQGKIATPNLSYGMEVAQALPDWFVYKWNSTQETQIEILSEPLIPSKRLGPPWFHQLGKWSDGDSIIFSDWSSTEIFIIRDRDYIIKWAHPLWFHDGVGWANNPCETRYIFQSESLIWIQIRWLHHLVSKPILILPLQG